MDQSASEAADGVAPFDLAASPTDWHDQTKPCGDMLEFGACIHGTRCVTLHNKMFRTYDGMPIIAGMDVYNYYDCKWGKVREWPEPPYLTSPGGRYFSGWFDVDYPDGTSNILDGSRMATYNPNG